jgi:phosphatidate cytidylyltransferase
MLKTRVVTAVVLLALLIAVIYSGSFLIFAAVAMLFFAASIWETFRLFGNKYPLIGAIAWAAVLGFFLTRIDSQGFPESRMVFALCAALWLIRFTPSLGLGLPAMAGVGNHLLNGIYSISICGCFLAITVLYKQSPLYLFSVMAIVWVADIGAYFTGKAWGKHKLAPSISPGKSWEGAIGGWIAVLALASLTAFIPALDGTFSAKLYLKWGWLGFAVIMSLIVAASIVGDLFESQLKRRANMKDSSNLLPGHGGVLDRIDALIPSLPLAALIHAWL